MKLQKIVFLFLSLAVVLFTSCKGEVDVTGISLDQAALSVNVGEKATVVATIQPKGAEATVTWTTSNSAVATVVNGEVTGVAAGTADIVATAGTFTAKCVVTVTTVGPDFSASLKGTEYYPIILDGVTATALGSKIKADFRPDDVTRFLYIWPDGTSYTNGTSVGPNFYGEVEPWASFIVAAPAGWSGAGYNVLTAGNEAALAKLKAITDNPDKYYLHIGIKSKDNASHVIILQGQTEVKFAIGPTGFVDNGVTIAPLADFTRDGEWQEIEIPIATLKDKGLSYSIIGLNPNIFAFLSGGVAGKTLDLDAVFIYKKQ